MSSYILYLETAQSHTAVGVASLDRAELLYQEILAVDSQRQHSTLLFSAIEAGLREADLPFKALSALSVNIGPGSFTGLRTGLTAVKTFAQFLNLPVYPLTTFDIWAAHYEFTYAPRPGAYLAMALDARQGQAYVSTVRFESDGWTVLAEPALVCFTTWLQEQQMDYLLISQALSNAEDIRIPPGVLMLPIEGEVVETIKCMHQALRLGVSRPVQGALVSPLYLQPPRVTLKKTIS